MGAAACSVLATALVCNAPAAPSLLTSHGAPLPRAVEIYRVAAPVVAPVVEPEQQPAPRPTRSKGLIWIGALIGGAAGCTIGGQLGDAGEETRACFLTAGIGAGLGALAVATAIL